ncbi:hypothetical protein CRG98_025613 [Punica granatum]|uniref:Uncharacterized protein n=1 Tax=Punica granatum TaxID=22663 RepID=A0A2I0JCP7_PUNGR|nr:hypothetical protein CRG98_025613 [Punica granatum]
MTWALRSARTRAVSTPIPLMQLKLRVIRHMKRICLRKLIISINGDFVAHEGPSNRSGQLQRLTDQFEKLLSVVAKDEGAIDPLNDICLIQDRTTRRTLGVGELQGRVYYLRRVAS